MIGTIQIALHIPLLAVYTPSNVLTFYSTLCPIINYDLLATFDWFNNFLEFISMSEEVKDKAETTLRYLRGKVIQSFRKGIGKQEIALGYDTRNPLVNQGTLTLVFF